MEEVVSGTRRAIATFEFNGPKRGMVVTTGRFTNPAEEYAQRLREHDDPYTIGLVDGGDLREIADTVGHDYVEISGSLGCRNPSRDYSQQYEEVGLDLYNGRIETLSPRLPVTKSEWPSRPHGGASGCRRLPGRFSPRLSVCGGETSSETRQACRRRR